MSEMYTTSGSMDLFGYQKTPFFVNQTGQNCFIDIPGLPSSEETDRMLDDTKSKMSATKWGAGAVKCFMTAEYVHHLVCCLLNMPGHEWLHAQEKHMITKEYMVDGDQHLCNIKGQKIIVREQIHELLVFLHLFANHQGRDASIDILRIHYPEISRKGITKALMSRWINLLCPTCMSKSKQLGPKTKRDKSSNPATKKLTSPKRNRVVKKQSNTVLRKAIPEHVLVSELAAQSIPSFNMAAQSIPSFEYEPVQTPGNSNYQHYLQAQYAELPAYLQEGNPNDSFDFSDMVDYGGSSGSADMVDYDESSGSDDTEELLRGLFPEVCG